MDEKEFANILVNELVDNIPVNSRKFLSKNGLNPDNLDDADEIWMTFVRFNVDVGGMKSSTVMKYWNMLDASSLLLNREKLINEVFKLKSLNVMRIFQLNAQ